MRRMTPAKLLALIDARMDHMAIQEMPVANFACLYYNSNRGVGDKDKGIEPPPALEISSFQVFKKSPKSGKVKSKDAPGGDHTKYGAKTDVAAWKSWAASKTKRR